MNAQVIPLPLSISNAYLLLGDRPVLVDAGAPGDGKRLVALIPLVQLLLAASEIPLVELPDSHIVSCDVNDNGRKVAELFDKYNLRSLPVLDHEKRLAGVIHAEQVIALLREKR